MHSQRALSGPRSEPTTSGSRRHRGGSFPAWWIGSDVTGAAWSRIGDSSASEVEEFRFSRATISGANRLRGRLAPDLVLSENSVTPR